MFVKRQVGHVFRSLRYPLGRPTAIRERDAYLAFAKLGINIPELVFVDARKNKGTWQAILVTRNLEGFITLKEWLITGGNRKLGAEGYKHFLQKLGYTLAKLHKGRWCHGSLHFKHIYVKPGSVDELPEIAFIDLERAQRKFTVHGAAKRDFHTLGRRIPKSNGVRILNERDWSVLLAAHQKALNGEE